MKIVLALLLLFTAFIFSSLLFEFRSEKTKKRFIALRTRWHLDTVLFASVCIGFLLFVLL
ncbi:MAG: hypothetical protein ACRC5C_02385 [Bacilli bacterium]